MASSVNVVLASPHTTESGLSGMASELGRQTVLVVSGVNAGELRTESGRIASFENRGGRTCNVYLALRELSSSLRRCGHGRGVGQIAFSEVAK
jgi:hypothetical protein